MPRLKIDGGCHCGKIRYEADVHTDNVIICHCTDCQAISGGPYRANVIVKAESFSLTGQPRTYLKTTADSGTLRLLAFCPDCGSGLYSTAVENPKVYNLRLGCVTQRAADPQGAGLLPLRHALGHGHSRHPASPGADPLAPLPRRVPRRGEEAPYRGRPRSTER